MTSQQDTQTTYTDAATMTGGPKSRSSSQSSDSLVESVKHHYLVMPSCAQKTFSLWLTAAQRRSTLATSPDWHSA